MISPKPFEFANRRAKVTPLDKRRKRSIQVSFACVNHATHTLIVEDFCRLRFPTSD
jgi:hypothetical protein